MCGEVLQRSGRRTGVNPVSYAEEEEYGEEKEDGIRSKEKKHKRVVAMIKG